MIDKYRLLFLKEISEQFFKTYDHDIICIYPLSYGVTEFCEYDVPDYIGTDYSESNKYSRIDKTTSFYCQDRFFYYVISSRIRDWQEDLAEII